MSEMSQAEQLAEIRRMIEELPLDERLRVMAIAATFRRILDETEALGGMAFALTGCELLVMVEHSGG